MKEKIEQRILELEKLKGNYDPSEYIKTVSELEKQINAAIQSRNEITANRDEISLELKYWKQVLEKYEQTFAEKDIPEDLQEIEDISEENTSENQQIDDKSADFEIKE